MRLLLLILMFGALTACSSNLKKGDNMMEAEQYGEAVQYYERAAQEDPGDTEIATKLYEARTRMVMANLIKVRLERQSQQFRSAALQLNSTLRNIKRWNIMADSGVKTTIEEEVQESSKWLNSELSSLGNKGEHNRFFYTLKQFKYVLDSGYADTTIEKFSPSMRAKGSQQCKAMKSQLTPQSAFLHDVWLAYCGVFGDQVSYALQKDSSRYTAPVIDYRQLKSSKDSDISAGDVAADIQNGIRQHPWFTPAGGMPLKLSLDGRVYYNVSKKPKTFNKTVMVYDETLELIKDPKDPEKVIRKLIQRKKVPKTVTFKGVEYDERYSHKVTLMGGRDGLSISAKSQQAEQKALYPSHTTYFKEQGISPLKVVFLNKQKWKRGIVQGLVQQTKKDLDQAWVKRFCSDQSILTGLSQNEYAARCAIIEPQHPLVNAWSRSEFTLSFDQLNVLLGSDSI